MRGISLPSRASISALSSPLLFSVITRGTRRIGSSIASSLIVFAMVCRSKQPFSAGSAHHPSRGRWYNKPQPVRNSGPKTFLIVSKLRGSHQRCIAYTGITNNRKTKRVQMKWRAEILCGDELTRSKNPREFVFTVTKTNLAFPKDYPS